MTALTMARPCLSLLVLPFHYDNDTVDDTHDEKVVKTDSIWP